MTPMGTDTTGDALPPGAIIPPLTAPTSTPEMGALVASTARASGHRVLDAGRGQPNWSATVPRAAFFRLGAFAVADAAAHSDSGHWGVLPPADGIDTRLRASLAADPSEAGEFLLRAVDFAVAELGYERDAWVHELVRAVLGAGYPSPNRMLEHLENVVEHYLVTMAGLEPGEQDRFELFATEGGAAAMAYVFASLKANELVGPGDAIAIATPVFTPYLQIPVLADFGFDVVEIASQHNVGHRFDDEALARLLDPRIKVFFLINPGNPDTRAVQPERLRQLGDLVRNQRPDLVIVADTAYATFVPGFRSVLAELPRNTVLIHSFSKNFGATGNRLGFVALAADTVLDDLIAAQPHDVRARQQHRYGSMTSDVAGLSFMRRMVADSREVALHNIAGLSTVDQVQMGLFALTFLLPRGAEYAEATRAELGRRLDALYGALGVAPPGGDDSRYYALVDVLQVVRARAGDEAAERLRAAVPAEEVPLRLARDHGVIVQPGPMFRSQAWDLRVCLAALPQEDLVTVGNALLEVLDGLVAGEPGPASGAGPA
jgi:aspartate 4-decarboxylase